MYFTKITAYAAIALLCIACNYVSDLTSGGGHDEGADEGIVLAADAVGTQQATDQNLETAGNAQNETFASSLNNMVTEITEIPKIAMVIDDWGQQCPLQNSEFCGGYGSALVSAHDDTITGLACGSGAFQNEMVVNLEWVPC